MARSQNKLKQPSEVYILHFKQPYWHKARHYIGYTTVGTQNRVDAHRNGDGSLLVNYAHNKKGIPFQIGLIEHFDTKEEARWREIRLKREGHLARHCKICQERSGQ